MEQDLTVIQNFNVAPQKSLELLGQRLGLRMSRAELLFCARHYKGRANGEISIDALRFIDALACPARLRPSKIAIGELLTDHDDIAETYADAISKLKALGKDPQKPFTLQDIADLSVRYTTAAKQKDVTEPIGFGGTAVQYAAQGFGVQIPLECALGHFDLLQPLPILPADHAAYADAILLLFPTEDMDEQAFGDAVTALLCTEAGDKIHAVCDLASESAAHAVLHLCSGAVLNLADLPDQMQSPLALTSPCTGLLLTLAQDAAPAVLQAAQGLGLCAYDAGTVDHAGYLIIRHGKDTLLTQDISYLRSICFIRSYTLRLEDAGEYSAPAVLQLRAPSYATDESCNAYDTVLRTLPPLRTRNAAYLPSTSFRASALCALKAYCTAVAAGNFPGQIWLNAQILQAKKGGTSRAAADMLSAMLGLYRASMELSVPVKTTAEFTPDQSCVAVMASAPSDTVIPERLQGRGKIYLLSPRFSADGLPVWSELRALIAYLRRAILDGKVKSARVICGSTPADELSEAASKTCGVILNPHGMQILDTPCVCAFLIETDEQLAGELIAVSTLPEYAQNAANSDNIS